ncbi:MAG: TIGR04282 family arsenosugar biosynthesis glycosyltransferase [Gammaproteobacteria bacterium]|nr:TIGR04282 family arsenosugar biosynthesis glycosyltransferase [Gammaproteobacteria bacterium]
MQYPHARILVFCKAPQAGKVKTRLAKNIGETAAKVVHEHLAWHCLQQMLGFAVAPVELWCAPDMDHDFFSYCHTQLGIPLKQQVGNDLGQRMQHAMNETLCNHAPVVLIGTDCPALTADYLQSACAAVSQNKTVIVPAEDGGYVLLGMNKLQPELFIDMPWGTSQVYTETMTRVTGEVETLKPLWDIDYIADLRRLHATSDIPLGEQFQAYLETLGLS